MNKRYSVEIDFILVVLSFFIHPESGSVDVLIQKLRAITDWEYVIDLASRHRILPFITLALDKANALKHVPAVIRNAMERDLHQAVLDNMAKMKQFKKYNRLFEEAGIPVIPLKGVAQTLMLYREAPVRRMGDIDILIRECDLRKCKRLLKVNGFCFQNLSPNRWQREVVVEIFGRSSYVKDELDIDLQWRPRFPIGDIYAELDLHDVWKYSTPCPELGTNVYFLSPKHQAQHLLLEITQDFDRGYLVFFQLFGLALMIHRFNLIADDILDVSRQFNLDAKRRIETMLRAVHESLIKTDKTEHRPDDADDMVRTILKSDLNLPGKMGLGRKLILSSAKMILEAPIPWFSKSIYFAGYFFPHPEHIRQKYGRGFKNWLKGHIGHWSRITGKAYHFFVIIISRILRRSV